MVQFHRAAANAGDNRNKPEIEHVEPHWYALGKPGEHITGHERIGPEPHTSGTMAAHGICA
jgi:hypothetical protein